jgi:aryl sulfotransferase
MRSQIRRKEALYLEDENIEEESYNIIQPRREVRDFLSYSGVWKKFQERVGFREGDIVIATYFKVGTTLTQNIVYQILHNGTFPQKDLAKVSPWLDSSFGNHEVMLADLKSQTGRRVIKSHMPADTIPIDPRVRYIYVGRDGRNVGLSFHHYLSHFTGDTIAKINKIYSENAGEETKLVIPASEQEFFDLWLNNDGYNCGAFFDNVRTWWDIRCLPNVMFLHYDKLAQDLKNQIPVIAKFLGISPETLDREAIIRNCSFDSMKRRAERLIPLGVSGVILDDAKAFFDKGPKRNYQEALTPEQIKRYETLAQEQLGEECARWLENGEMKSKNINTTSRKLGRSARMPEDLCSAA